MNLLIFRVYTVIVLMAILFGYIVELIQGSLISGRYFDPADIVANSIGTFFGVLFYHWIGRKLI